MDLKKLFVYVPTASEATFISSVINVPAEAAKYANKIVFLEGSHRIWVKEKFYGTDPSDLTAIWTALGIQAGTTPSGSYTVGEQTFSYANFAEWIAALKNYTDAKIAAEKAEIVTSYEAADAALNAAYTAFKNKVGAIDGLTGTLKEYIDDQDASARTEVAVSGSGISVAKTAGADGHDIYTITADQSIWEFMGTAWAADVASVPTVLDAKYPAARATGKEAGDVWSVGIGGTEAEPSTTILYAYDGANWVQIGSAQGISGVDTTPSHGVNLTSVASVVGINVTPGSVADGNDSVITGGAAYTAINAAQDNAYAYTKSVGDAIIAAYEAADAALQDAIDDVVTAYEAADAAIISAYEAADAAIISAYEAADAALNTRINNLDATYTGGEQIGGNDLFTYNLTQVDGQVTAAEVTFDKTVMFNYVTDNIWETYGA